MQNRLFIWFGWFIRMGRLEWSGEVCFSHANQVVCLFVFGWWVGGWLVLVCTSVPCRDGWIRDTNNIWLFVSVYVCVWFWLVGSPLFTGEVCLTWICLFWHSWLVCWLNSLPLLSLSLSLCLCLSVSVCLSVCLTVCLSVCLALSLSLSLSLCLCVCMCMWWLYVMKLSQRDRTYRKQTETQTHRHIELALRAHSSVQWLQSI